MSTRTETTQVAISILDKEYMIACPAEQQEELLESARLLDRKMREIRGTGKVVGIERVAVMAALNIAHELVQERSREGDYTNDLEERLHRLQNRIDSVLREEDPQMKF